MELDEEGMLMNIRQRRKQAAQEHNDRIELMQELSDLQLAIYTKHGVRVRVEIDSRNYSVVREIEKLRGILEADTPPPRSAPRRSGIRRGGLYATLALAALGEAMGVNRGRS